MNRLLVSAAGLGLLISHPVQAEILDQQAVAPSVADRTAATALSDVVVTANRSAQAIDRVGASVTVLTRAALEASQASALPDSLVRTPGLSFTRNGGVGSPASLHIRGAEGHHTVVVIDGVKMNDPSLTQGNINFSNLMVGDLGRIEILRGAQSTLWGSQAIGGVVNLISAEPTQTLEGNLSAEAGSRGTRAFKGGIGGALDRLTWRLAANRYETDGFSNYATGTEDDAYRHTNLSGRLNFKLTDDASIDLRSHYTDGTNSFDAWNGDSPEYGRTQEWLSYAGGNFALMGGRLRNRIGYSHTETHRHNADPRRSLETVSFEAEGANKRFDYQGVYAFSNELSATFGLETESAEMRTRTPLDSLTKPGFSVHSADLDSAYTQVQWAALPNLNLTAGMRYDDHAQYGDKTLGQFAAAFSLNEGKTVLRASWGQGFRAPGLYELYSEYGNLTLQPEEFDAWELGLQQKLGDRASIGLTYFSRQADNEIRYYGCDFGTTDPLCTINGVGRWGYYTNLQKTEAQGIEVSGQIDITQALHVSANYSWTEALNASGGNKGRQLVRRPEHMANLSADYSFRTGLKTGVSVRYSGEVFTNEANTSTLDAYTLVDLRVSYPINKTLEVYGRIENLLDEQYQIVQDYGTADRGLFGGVRIRF